MNELELLTSKNSGAQFYETEQCRVTLAGESAQVRVEHEESAEFEIITNLYVNETQNIRLTIGLTDFVADIFGDSSVAKIKLSFTIQERMTQ